MTGMAGFRRRRSNVTQDSFLPSLRPRRRGIHTSPGWQRIQINSCAGNDLGLLYWTRHIQHPAIG